MPHAAAMLRQLALCAPLQPAAPTWPGILHLGSGECLTLGLPDALRMTCMRGHLRVLAEGSAPAREVAEGQTYCPGRARQLLVTALAPSTVVLAPGAE